MIDLFIKNKNYDNIVFNQYMGIGDILFSIPIAKKLNDIGYNIIWPVNKSFLNIQENFDFILFHDKEEYEMNYNCTEISFVDRNIIIPLRFANNLINYGNPITCMSDKYKLLDIPLEYWRTLSWKRNIEKENDLFYNLLRLSDNDEYNLINETYSMTKGIKIDCNNGLRNIKFEIIDGFNILDWYKVIENSTNIHTVGTSLVFIIEVVPTPKLSEYVLYPRVPEESNCDYYNYLLTKPTTEKINR